MQGVIRVHVFIPPKALVLYEESINLSTGRVISGDSLRIAIGHGG